MTIKPFARKFLKTIAVIAVLMVGFHLWFIYHTEQIVEDLVNSQSNGKVRLKVRKVKFNYFSRHLELRDAVFYTGDSISQNVSYRFIVRRINVKAKTFWPLLFKKRLQIDSMFLHSPHVEITRLRAGPGKDTMARKDISLAGEMGKIYNSIQSALAILKIKRFELDNGKFTLINRVQPGRPPISITNIDFHIDNLDVYDSTKKNTRFLFSDNIVLRTYDQQIEFPDGRHSIAFSKFRLNIRKKIIDIDSCTIRGEKSDSGRVAFDIFFRSLELTNVDFNALADQNLIKADSVYCMDPKFNFTIALREKKTPKKKSANLNLNRLTRQLSSNLQLKFVGVTNADFTLNRVRDDRPLVFNSNHDNFSIYNLKIDNEAEQLYTIGGFDMAIRHYENLSRDSTMALRFDSIHFQNDTITLSNFSLKSTHASKNGEYRSFVVPSFKLTGLSWEELIFNRKVEAERATLYNPVIAYKQGISKNKARKQSLFYVLGGIDDLMKLQQLQVVNGSLNLLLNSGVHLSFEHTNIGIESNALLSSRSLQGIEQSVNELKFTRGNIYSNNLQAELKNVLYSGSNQKLNTEELHVTNAQKTLDLTAKNVSLGKIEVLNKHDKISVDGLHWQQAVILLNPDSVSKSGSSQSIQLKNIRGNNTHLTVNTGRQHIQTHFNNFVASNIIMSGNKFSVDDLDMQGDHLQIENGSSSLAVKTYAVADNKRSVLEDVSYHHYSNADTIAMTAPALRFVPDVASLINGEVITPSLTINQPVIKITSGTRDDGTGRKKVSLPKINIEELTIEQPSIHIEQNGSGGRTTFNHSNHPDNEADNTWKLGNVKTNPGTSSLSVDQVHLNSTDMQLNSPGKIVGIDKGLLQLSASAINARAVPDSGWEWSALLNKIMIRKLLPLYTTKNGEFTIDAVTLENTNVSGSSLKDISRLWTASPGLELTNLNGHFADSINEMRFYNGRLSNAARTFTLDSFSYQPIASKAQFIASHRYQADYLNMSTGKIELYRVDPYSYLHDSILAFGSVHIDKGNISIFRDKQKEFLAGNIKPLPVAMIKKLPLHLSIDSIVLTDARVSYTEVSDKTGDTGTVYFTRLRAQLFPVRNINISGSDTLRLRAYAYLMDTAWMRLRVREPYGDTSAGFFMTLRLKPADLRILNPALIKMASVKLSSGYLDTLSMRGVGRETLSLGEMKMYYHDLRVQFLKNGNETKKGFLKGLMTFVANNFIIRNQNRSRIGTVYFPRFRDRSIFNYLVKMTLSGVVTSIGAKKNKRYDRRYQRELGKQNLPPIDLD